MKNFIFYPLIGLMLIGTPAKVLAHAVETNYQLSSQLELQTVYSSGEPLQQAEVIVYAPNDPSKPWLVGKTDEQGKFSFLPDSSIPGDWSVEIHQEGHEDYLTVPVTNQGVDVNNISEGNGKDIHYAVFPPSILALMTLFASLAGIGGAVWAARQPKP